MNLKAGTLVGVVVLMAFGSTPAHSSGLSQPPGYQQFLAYSKCMRAHGAPFWPDPVILDSGVFDAPVGYQITRRILDQEQGPGWQAARQSCQRYQPGSI